MKYRSYFAVLTLLLSLPLDSFAAELRLRILQTTDVHMSLLDYDYYQDKPTTDFGLARTATLIAAARTEAPNNLLFDNGDLLQGNPLGDQMARITPLRKGQVHPAIKVLQWLKIDAANIGNHDFNYGLPFLRQVMAGAKYPYLNANVMLADRPAQHAFKPYVILQRDFKDEAGARQRLKIGVIGLVPTQIMMWDRQNLEGKLVARDMVETARRLIPEIRAKGADLIIVIAHTGLDKAEAGPMAENVAGQLAQVPGVDALLLGHAHAEFPGPEFAEYPGADIKTGRLYGTPAVMPGRWGDHLGLIDLRLDKVEGRWKLIDSQASLRPILDSRSRKPLVEAAPQIGQLIAAEHQATLAHVRAEVARSEAPVFSYFAQVADDPSVQLVSNAQLAYGRRVVQGTAWERLPLLSSAAPFKAGGRQGPGNYTDIPAGPMAIKNVADLYVYPNTIKLVKLSGAEVREWLEMSAGQFRRIDPKGPAEQPLIDEEFRSYNFDTLDGVQYAIDLTQPARYTPEGKLVAPDSHRIVGLNHGGQPVDDKAEFLVVTNSYRATGGGNFPALKSDRIVIDTPDENREAVAAYLASQARFNPSADGNWRLLPVPGVKLRFVSGSGGIKYLDRMPQIQLLRDRGDGWADYELRP
ncbi:bifunctional 2',3'-cyclic-nucleotide 2'-phosphodiesterase/3'-nucleotidase [Pelomonas sp. SE-A7]|uniref:bifunctional 2',3'-cyclic-nucleotide 2'-phosphodiesterase/3'-nucleotidase n=1 Tax=Pelomonas sp. SE-A7 TaxID=3054953 RepID=UPI00259CEE54|nr:bifunctional 2',3'-cyclic-nucleotide 2'-phosphodiesterase/3'-nucleotidase [Pelomonas sp. SE-A7]MDM4764924.1 bifunctional 2',3'-cyclic-nucleotide 2'-phosphodiesterase/3'-nucleotidase [Pelomonas sp. SE-A7]